MAGVKNLRKLQIGVESTKGTAVPATAVLRMNGTIEDQREKVFPEEATGYLGGTDRMYEPKLLATIPISGEATYEQLPYFFQACIEAESSSADGVGTDKIWEWDFPTTALKDIKTYTIEAGDNQAVDEMEYAYVSELTLSGKYGEAWMVDATWIGRQSTVSAFSASCTLPTVEEILFNKTKLYVDACTTAFGTTLKSNTLLEAELKITSGWIPKFTADGNIYFSFLQCTAPEVTLDITFEHDATATGELAFWRSGTARQVRLIATGTSVATAGTVYTYKTLIIDLAGKWEKFDKIDEIDGNDVLKGTFRAKYDATSGLWGRITIANEVETLP